MSLSGCICRQWQRSCAVQLLTSTCQGSLWCYNNHQIRSQFTNDRMKQVCPYYGSIKLETFHECSKLEAVAPSVPVSARLSLFSLARLRHGHDQAAARVKTSQSCQFFWWVSSVRQGPAHHRVIFAQSSFQILTSRHTHSRSDERQGNQHSLCSLFCWRLSMFRCLSSSDVVFLKVACESGANAVFECNFRPLLSDCV